MQKIEVDVICLQFRKLLVKIGAKLLQALGDVRQLGGQLYAIAVAIPERAP